MQSLWAFLMRSTHNIYHLQSTSLFAKYAPLHTSMHGCVLGSLSQKNSFQKICSSGSCLFLLSRKRTHPFFSKMIAFIFLHCMP